MTSFLSRLYSFIFSIGYLYALVWGAWDLMANTISLGTLTAILQLVGQVQMPVAELSGMLPKLYGVIASAERLIELENLPDEVEMNILRFEGRSIPAKLKEASLLREKRLHVDYWCEGCGRCVERCKQQAISIVEGKAIADPEKCVLCGYCGSVCPQFAIKIC
jgi:ferredoxin